MSISETVMEKLNALPLEKQKVVLHFVESISGQDEARLKNGGPYEWMDIALKAGLSGPADWSENLDDYLYGNRKNAG